MTDLKSCPFCGAKDGREYIYRMEESRTLMHFGGGPFITPIYTDEEIIRCKDCIYYYDVFKTCEYFSVHHLYYMILTIHATCGSHAR